jgi:hypothetical protein
MTMKALIIRSPWIDLILEGKKTWEMRTRQTHMRGRIALIRAGSGHIYATAELVDCLQPLNAEQMRLTRSQHGIADGHIASVLANKWSTPWVLRDVRLLKAPVPYSHPSGAVTWVDLPNFDDEASCPSSPVALTAPPARVGSTKPVAVVPQQVSQQRQPQPKSAPGQWADIPLTQGNLNNHHFYLRAAVSLLPKDSIGGKNKDEPGRPIQVSFQPGQMVETDVDGGKMILRSRSPIRDFFERSGCAAGDAVRITRVAERQFVVTRVCDQ